MLSRFNLFKTMYKEDTFKNILKKLIILFQKRKRNGEFSDLNRSRRILHIKLINLWNILI